MGPMVQGIPASRDSNCLVSYPLWLEADDDLFFIFRNYIEPATSAGPDDNELVFDRAIYFGPYDFPTECPTGCTPLPR